jgi:hypothetical protein
VNLYCHHVSGFFAHLEQAEIVISKLIANGLPCGRVHIFNKNAISSHHEAYHEAKISNHAVLKDVLAQNAIVAGKIVVIAETLTTDETYMAGKIMQAVIGDSHDVL